MPSHQDDYVSFDKALRDLQLRSEELKRLVSEGEIRAFRDGDSMKFKREDLESLQSVADGEDSLEFVDSLEDDTGMVTEELSDEDTLLVEEDYDDEPVAPARAARASGRVRQVTEVGEAETTPGWVTAAAVVGSLMLVWGLLIVYSIAAEMRPEDSFLTGFWGK